MKKTRGYDNGEVRYVLNNLADLPETVELPFPLTGDQAEQAVQQATSLLEGFDVLGTSDHYDAFVEAVAQRVGLRSEPLLPHVNKTPAKKDSKTTDEAEQLAEAHTEYDRELLSNLA